MNKPEVRSIGSENIRITELAADIRRIQNCFEISAPLLTQLTDEELAILGKILVRFSFAIYTALLSKDPNCYSAFREMSCSWPRQFSLARGRASLPAVNCNSEIHKNRLREPQHVDWRLQSTRDGRRHTPRLRQTALHRCAGSLRCGGSLP